jgi:hypothetical protein
VKNNWSFLSGKRKITKTNYDLFYRHVDLHKNEICIYNHLSSLEHIFKSLHEEKKIEETGLFSVNSFSWELLMTQMSN